VFIVASLKSFLTISNPEGDLGVHMVGTVECSVIVVLEMLHLQNEFDGTEGGNIWIISDLDCLDYRVTIEESLHSRCETGCTSEKDSEQICLISDFSFVFLFVSTKKSYV
jgi:hypothetical protein